MAEGTVPRPFLATRAARKSAPASGGTRIPRGSPGAIPTPYLAVVGAERSLPAICERWKSCASEDGSVPGRAELIQMPP